MLLELRNNGYNNNVKDVYIRDDKKVLKIFYGDNGDLYFDIFGDRKVNNDGFNYTCFSIDMSDSLFPFFETLYDDIVEYRVFDDSDRLNKYLKEKNANENLVNDGKIIFYSDSTYDESANILKISKINNSILLEFIDNEDDYIFGFGIRISNSGSKYDPFNICFMRLFNNLQNVGNSLSDNSSFVKRKTMVNN